MSNTDQSLVIGETPYGHTLMDEREARDWAEAARLLWLPLTWPDLLFRLPDATRLILREALASAATALLGPLLDDDRGRRNPGSVPTHRWGESMEASRWPWFPRLGHQPLPIGRFPHHTEIRTPFGLAVSYPDPDGLVSEFPSIRRADTLVDAALGPHGSLWGQPAPWECSCRRHVSRACGEHPGASLSAPTCPACGADQLDAIGYGMPAGPSPGYMQGGCVVDDSQPHSVCRACGIFVHRDGTLLRRHRRGGYESVASGRLPRHADHLQATFATGLDALGEPLSVPDSTVDITGFSICGRWWLDIPGLGSCTCRGVDTGATYTATRDPATAASSVWGEDPWTSPEPGWVGMLHLPSERVLMVRRRDGVLIGIGDPDTDSVIGRVAERLGEEVTEIRRPTHPRDRW